MRVAVIGGGVIGASIAWRLAQRDIEVVVLDDRARAGAASTAAAGMLAPLAEAHQPGPFLQLGLESLRRWPSFVAELEELTGQAIGYARAGKLVVALTHGEADDLAATYAWQERASHAPAEWLDGAQARELEPALAPDVRAAVLIRDDHRVDPALLAQAVARAGELSGVHVLAKRATGLVVERGRVAGIDARDDRIEADAVVLAAGAWSARLDGLPRALPIRPVRGQLLALRPERMPFGRTLAGAEGYLVPRADGRVIVGSTMEDVGFDARTTPDALATLRALALRLVPGLARAARVGAWAGLRPATPDGLPVLGPDPELRGLFYATGHLRNGILLTPVSADAVSASILGGSDVDLTPFSPVRFATAQTAPSSVRTAGSSAPRAATGTAASDDRLCDLCGSPMYEVHCKLVCRACGYKRDCSDLW